MHCCERTISNHGNIQYCCIDGKYRIDVGRLRKGGKMSFSESLHPFRAEPHTLYIYSQYCISPAIQFRTKKKLFNLIIKKDNGNPIDTSIVVAVRVVA